MKCDKLIRKIDSKSSSVLTVTGGKGRLRYITASTNENSKRNSKSTVHTLKVFQIDDCPTNQVAIEEEFVKVIALSRLKSWGNVR